MDVGTNYPGKMLAVSKSRYFFFPLNVGEEKRKKIEL